MSAARGLLFCGILVATAIGGCAVVVPITTCPERTPDPPVPLTCEAAASAAGQQYGSVAGITALRFEYQICPPNARCAFPDGAAGNVIATLGDGRELAVFVSISAGSFRPRSPGPSRPNHSPRRCPEARIAHMFDLADRGMDR